MNQYFSAVNVSENYRILVHEINTSQDVLTVQLEYFDIFTSM